MGLAPSPDALKRQMSDERSYFQKNYHYWKQFHPLGQEAIDYPWLLDYWLRGEIGSRMKPPPEEPAK